MSAPHVYVEELHEVPIATVWEMLSGFGTWADWFPLFDFMRIINSKDGVGAVRKFDTLNGYTYEEELIEKNDGEYYLQYDTLSVKPAIYGLVSVKTTIKLETVEAKQTKIVWSAWIVTEELDAESLDFILNKVKSVLEVFFQAATQSITQKIITGQYIKDTLASYNGKVMAITRALIIGKAETWEYDDYPKNLGPLPRMVRGLPPSEAMPAYRLGQMAGRTLEVAYLQIAELLDSIGTTKKEKKEDEIDYKKECLSLSNYGHGQTKQRKTLTRRIAERWEDDVEFCQQLLQGVNPLHIRMVKHAHEVPFQMHGLTVTEKTGEIKTLHQLITEKRLLMLDYREFASFELKEDKYFYPAVMLIYREILDESNSRLNVLGIHLDPVKNEVFTPDMPQKNRYKLARMFIACADNQFHEFRYHLGISHLGMEPIVVAVHNRLPKRTKKNPHLKTHPVRILLEPHLEDTIGINFMARHTLIDAKNPSTDKPFSLGTHQGLKLASNGWAKYDFFKNSFPEDMKARGFDEERTDGVQDYHFRDDGFKLWHAIGHYTIDAINHIYADDDAVRSDSELQKWAYEMSDRDGAAIPGFPEFIETRKLLAHVIQIIIWNGSALHSSIGMPQFTYLSYVPNRPLAIYKPMPDLGEDGADIDEEYIKRALPSKSLTLFQTSMSWILSLPSETSLMDLMALNGIHDDVDTKFHQNLQRLNEEFRARNKELEAQGKAPYIFLMPENVACSVDI